jgi:hemolysin-activating ACP:hemolysin acyltransferase
MITEIISPLMPLTQSVDQGIQESESVDQAQSTIPLFQTVGVLLSIYARHRQYDTQTIGQWLSRVMPFLNHQQARLFITEDKTPYGFASWVEVPEAIHQQLLKDATWECAEPQLAQLLSGTLGNNEPYYLWFIDLLTPFSHALAATKDLKQQLSNHQSAWILNINQGQHGPRQVW